MDAVLTKKWFSTSQLVGATTIANKAKTVILVWFYKVQTFYYTMQSTILGTDSDNLIFCLKVPS